jgi:hypothetical protein
MIKIEGQPPSAQIRAELAATGEPVLLAFSRGKDSIAAWLALRDSGVTDIRPYHMYLIPRLSFVDKSLAYYEDWFGATITNLPHPSLYRWLNNTVFTPPERLPILEAAQMPTPSYEEMVGWMREDWELPGAWVCDGVRAADSPVRRLSMATHGVRKEKTRKVSVVWDWKIADVRAALRRAKIELPPEYEWFGRSFDGIDRRFMEPLAKHAPEDYQRILHWFPLADLWRFRATVGAA